MKKLILLLAFCFFALPCFAGTSLTLRPAVEIDRASIRLADVFMELPDGLDREIAIAPEPGKSVTYNARVLTKLAEEYRLDWRPQSVVEKTVIVRAATRITTDMIEQAVLAKLAEIKRLKKNQIELTFDNRNIALNLPASSAPDFELTHFSYDERSRRFRSDLVALDSRVSAQIPVSGRVVVKKNVPVLGRTLQAGTLLANSDFDWVLVNEDQLGAEVVLHPELLVGQELRHDHAAGEYLRSNDVIAPRLVTRGSLVTLKIETPYMQITAQGRALQDGTEGDVVRITNTQSNRVVEGTVESSGVVRIGALKKVTVAEVAR